MKVELVKLLSKSQGQPVLTLIPIQLSRDHKLRTETRRSWGKS